ncbi:nuclear egress membrane protein [macacine betaherpesvirus 9]|uniref:Nuclear egress membrane protein n=1 Tax=macacine betaherpesvirus 9 TaxID=2560568 RepID=A0A191S3V3_9BETA|nr:nuclear egress membrane protein [macacine betaherpesvirus 9]ANC96575.1 nuclear egress membrane protein [macacine betaherpesvirus 9]
MLKEKTYDELIVSTCRILKLGPNEFRVTDKNLFTKNPKFPLCDILLKLDFAYSLEYLLSLWEDITKQEARFIFKNTGGAVSMSCYLHAPIKVEHPNTVKECNILNVNECLSVCLHDIEAMKPSSCGVLTKCIIRRNRDSAFIIEFVAFGPESETEYIALLKAIFLKKTFLERQNVEKNKVVRQIKRPPKIQTKANGIMTSYKNIKQTRNKKETTLFYCRVLHFAYKNKVIVFFSVIVFLCLCYVFLKTLALPVTISLM